MDIKELFKVESEYEQSFFFGGGRGLVVGIK
jgi:hypothetical protein